MANKTRNDSLLNSGISSALDRRVAVKQQELHDRREAEKQSVAAKLGSMSDRGKVVLDWINEEKKKLDSFSSFVPITNLEAAMKMFPVISTLNVDNKDLLAAQILARYMNIDFVNQLETKAKKHLREDKS